MQKRFNSIKNKDCSDDSNIRTYACIYKGIYFIGLDPSEVPFDATYKQFLDNALNSRKSEWELCLWHKENGKVTSHDETYPNQVDIETYEDCRMNGSLILNGHVHIYERTKVWSSFNNPKVRSNNINIVNIGDGYTFNTIAGIGGRPFEYKDNCDKEDCSKFAKRYVKGKPGVLYITFNPDGRENQADAKFVNILGEVIDQYTIINDNIKWDGVIKNDTAILDLPKSEGIFAKLLNFFKGIFRK